MKSDILAKVYKMVAAGSAASTTYRLLDGKTDELVLDEKESILGAFIIGAGQMAITITVGCLVAATFSKKI